MKNNFWYLILISFSLWGLNELFIFKPTFFFASLALGLLIIAFSVRFFLKNKNVKFWPVIMLPPALFYLSLSFYSAIIINQLLIQIIFLLNTWFIYSYLKNIYYYFSFGAPAREAKLHQLILSGTFLNIFALAAVLYGMPIFFDWPFGLSLLLFSALSAIIFGQFFIFTKQISSEQKIFWGINTLILTEFSGVLFLLPLNYNVLGLLVAIMFYVLVLINDWQASGKLNRKNCQWLLIISFLIIISLLLVARWL